MTIGVNTLSFVFELLRGNLLIFTIWRKQFIVFWDVVCLVVRIAGLDKVLVGRCLHRGHDSNCLRRLWDLIGCVHDGLLEQSWLAHHWLSQYSSLAHTQIVVVVLLILSRHLLYQSSLLLVLLLLLLEHELQLLGSWVGLNYLRLPRWIHQHTTCSLLNRVGVPTVRNGLLLWSVLLVRVVWRHACWDRVHALHCVGTCR